MSSDNRLHVLVFKDNLASRAFKIPLRWFFGAGVLASLAGIAIVLTGYAALHYYHVAARSDASLVVDLERRVETLQKQLDEAKSQPPVSPEAGQAQPPPAVPETPLTGGEATASVAGLFSAFPQGVRPAAPGYQPPVQLQDVSFDVRRDSVTLQYALSYVANDGKSQQGRIVILARGPNVLMASPAGTLQSPEKGFLVNPQAGEYFSVSRYRQGQTEFHLANAAQRITEVQILIFGQDLTLILSQKYEPKGQPKQSPAPAPTPNSGP